MLAMVSDHQSSVNKNPSSAFLMAISFIFTRRNISPSSIIGWGLATDLDGVCNLALTQTGNGTNPFVLLEPLVDGKAAPRLLLLTNVVWHK